MSRFAFVVLVAVLLASPCCNAMAATYQVSLDGTGDFAVIQEAIDASVDGDEIVVHPGTYYENIHFNGKNITLRSTDPKNWDVVNATVIDGQSIKPVVQFNGTEDGSCLLSGFTITNGYEGRGESRGAGISGADSGVWPYCRATISNCLITGNRGVFAGGVFGCDGLITNCLVTGNIASECVGGMFWVGTASNCLIASNEGGAAQLTGGGLFGCELAENCTIVNNEAFENSGVRSCTELVNCILWGNRGRQFHFDLNARYCCIENWDGIGEGNTDSDPLFVSGPLGRYYLDPASPCIDAGSVSAAEAGLFDRTTQTDDSPDTGIVDMGYHYPIPEALYDVTVECTLNDSRYAVGDLMQGFLTADNRGAEVVVDIYIAFMMPDGAIYSLTPDGIAGGIGAWLSNVTLPPGFTGPEKVFELVVPGSVEPGLYWCIAALAPSASPFEFIAMDMAHFEITESAPLSDFYVDAQHGDDGSDGSEQHPWRTITYALDSVEGSEAKPITVHVAAGSYSASTNGETFPLNMKSWMVLQGHSHEDTIIDGEFNGARGVQVLVCEDADSPIIEKLTITGGNVYEVWQPIHCGGGICCIDSSLTVRDCVVSHCGAGEMGGCIYVSGHKPVHIADCEITGGSGDGGGIGARDAIVEVRRTVMSNGGGGSYGGSIYSMDSKLSVTSSLIADGHVWFGGAIAVSGGSCEVVDTQILDHIVSLAGGAIYASGCDLTVSDSLFTRCAVYGSGGAISAWGKAAVEIRNCIIADNWALDGGAFHGQNSTLILSCCTVVDNSAGPLGGMYLERGRLEAKNSILRGPSALDLGTGETDISYCNVLGGWEGKGNFDADPLFVSGPRGGYCLSSSDAGQEVDSPCLDAGYGTADENGVGSRTTRTDGTPDTGTVDVGYHYIASSPQADFYVDPVEGDDGNSGIAPDDAYATVHCALAESRFLGAAVVSIHLAPGTYSTTTNDEQFPLTPQRAVRIIGAGAQETILDATGTNSHIFNLEKPEVFQLEGVTLTGGANALTCSGYCDPSIKHCVIMRNGAGLFAVYCSPLLEECTISENTTPIGSAVQAGFGSSVRLVGCTITRHNCWSGPVLVDDARGEVILESCLACDNHVEGEGGVVKAQFGGKTKCFNSLFINNSAGRGGVIASLDPNTPVEVRSCTFSGNTAVLEAGAVYSRNGELTVSDSIFWDNSTGVVVESGYSSVRHSCIQGGYEGDGNIHDDPMFVSGPCGDYYLDPASPCIDAGSRSAAEAGLSDRTTQADGTPDVGLVDMGFHYPIQ